MRGFRPYLRIVWAQGSTAQKMQRTHVIHLCDTTPFPNSGCRVTPRAKRTLNIYLVKGFMSFCDLTSNSIGVFSSEKLIYRQGQQHRRLHGWLTEERVGR